MNRIQFLAWIQQKAPKTLTELRYCPLSVKRFRHGAYRDCFAVPELDLVVKMPIDTEHYTGIEREGSILHTKNEVNTIRRVNSTGRLAPLRRYMPELLYADTRNGVTIYPKYNPVTLSQMSRSEMHMIEYLVNDLFPDLPYELDFGANNFGRLAHDEPECRRYIGDIVLLDGGLIGDRH